MNKPTYYIDTHAHLYREYYPEDLQGVIQRAVDARVEKVLLACVDALTPPMIAEAVKGAKELAAYRQKVKAYNARKEQLNANRQHLGRARNNQNQRQNQQQRQQQQTR